MDNGNQEEIHNLQNLMFRSLGLATQIAAVVVLSVLGSLFLGLWADRTLGTSPWLTLLLLGLGTLVAVLGFYRVVAPVIASVTAVVEMPDVAKKRDVTPQEIAKGQAVAPLQGQNLLGPLGFVMKIGLVTLLPPVAGLFMGLWLNFGQWAALALAFAGALVGLVGAWRLSASFIKKAGVSPSQEENV